MRYLSILFIFLFGFCCSLQAEAQNQNPSVMVFSAKWCGACKLLKPVVEEMKSKYAGRINIEIIDADASRDVLDKYSIKALPTILFMQNGSVVLKKQGFIDSKAFEDNLKSAFNLK